MSSRYTNLFKDIQDRIKNNLPDVKFVNLDLNQEKSEHPALLYPAVLIDFPATEFEAAGIEASGTLQVTLKLVFKTATNASSITPEASLDKALAFFDIEEELQELFMNYDPGYCSAFMIKQSEGENLDNNLRTRKLTFTTIF